MTPPTPVRKVVSNWEDLEIECEALGEFNSTAQTCLEDLLRAINHKNGGELRQAVARWSSLKARPVFAIDPKLYGGVGRPKLTPVH